VHIWLAGFGLLSHSSNQYRH